MKIVLMYHQVDDNLMTKYNVPFSRFQKQIELISSQRLPILSPEEFPLLNNGVLISFDDGHVSNLQAARFLSTLKISAIFYIVIDFIGKPDYLRLIELKEILSLGHHLGIHGYDHVSWMEKGNEELINDIRRAQDYFKTELNYHPKSVSAPGGKISSHEFRLIMSNFSFDFVRSSLPKPATEENCKFYGSFVIVSSTSFLEIKLLLKGNRLLMLCRYLFYEIKNRIHALNYIV